MISIEIRIEKESYWKHKLSEKKKMVNMLEVKYKEPLLISIVVAGSELLQR